MLIKINLENFKSFDKKTELNMISSSKIQSFPDHKVKVKQTSILKNAVLYGANASGKSNLIDFFRFFKWTVEKGLPLGSKEFFCKNRVENRERESEFEIQFTVKNKFYAYGFSSLLSKGEIKAEWLYELKQDGTANMLFQHEQNKIVELGSHLSLTDAEKMRFKVYAEDYRFSEGSLFLTDINHNKQYSPDSNLIVLRDVFTWLKESIVVITPSTSLPSFEYYHDDASMNKINRLIKTLDTGISEVKIKSIDMDEIQKSLPESIYEDILSDIQEHLSKKRKGRILMRGQDSFFNILFTEEGIVEVSTICMKHGRSVFDFSYKEESDGTRRIFELMDMILSRKENIVYVVDELERSLHPKLTAHFLKLFMQAHSGDQVQLVFSTHEASLMDIEQFRRDEFWFIERETDNNSRIYSLDRFKERYDRKLSKAYLEGRYGAIPIFQTFDFVKGD